MGGIPHRSKGRGPVAWLRGLCREGVPARRARAPGRSHDADPDGHHGHTQGVQGLAMKPHFKADAHRLASDLITLFVARTLTMQDIERLYSKLTIGKEPHMLRLAADLRELSSQETE